MPKINIDIDELDLQSNELIWLNLGSYKILIQGDGLVEVCNQSNQVLAVTTIEKLVAYWKVQDEGRHPGN